MHHIIIAGAGLNGLACAVALGGPAARIPVDICLIDARDPAGFRNTSFDDRASAITATSRAIFEGMGIWDKIAPHAQPMQSINVSDGSAGDSPGTGLLQFGGPQHAGPPSAYMVENKYLYAAIYDAAIAAPNISIRANQPIEAYRFEKSHAGVTLQSGEDLHCTLLIAADGRNSRCRAAAGIERMGWDYDQSAIVTTVAHQHPHAGRAEEFFRPPGPFAILPLTGNRSSLVWTEKRGEAERIVALDDQAFHSELMQRFGTKLGTVELAGTRQAFALSMYLAKSFTGSRLALIGDAAHFLHPIAGLGFNLGLRDVAALTGEIYATMMRGLDHGSPETLARYQSARRLDTLKVAFTSDGMNRLFSNDSAILRALRDRGLGLVNRSGLLKDVFMREAAGLGAGLPRLMTGEPA